ncbi:uncharacterized protein VTP21DRAFT_6093 [Calcarisporiella thermophila]|uniref:uncharacterized protein n=1 Tax=Calcarisporiella thermophila TaxID=911321 RepID=UPI00374369ED
MGKLPPNKVAVHLALPVVQGEIPPAAFQPSTSPDTAALLFCRPPPLSTPSPPSSLIARALFIASPSPVLRANRLNAQRLHHA